MELSLQPLPIKRVHRRYTWVIWHQMASYIQRKKKRLFNIYQCNDLGAASAVLFLNMKGICLQRWLCWNVSSRPLTASWWSWADISKTLHSELFRLFMNEYRQQSWHHGLILVSYKGFPTAQWWVIWHRIRQQQSTQLSIHFLPYVTLMDNVEL